MATHAFETLGVPSLETRPPTADTDRLACDGLMAAITESHDTGARLLAEAARSPRHLPRLTHHVLRESVESTVAYITATGERRDVAILGEGSNGVRVENVSRQRRQRGGEIYGKPLQESVGPEDVGACSIVTSLPGYSEIRVEVDNYKSTDSLSITVQENVKSESMVIYDEDEQVSLVADVLGKLQGVLHDSGSENSEAIRMRTMERLRLSTDEVIPHQQVVQSYRQS